MTEPRILTDDELRQIGALQVTPGSAHLRTGQRAFNALDSLLPDLADRIRATGADPFHVDGRIEAFVGALAAEITALRARLAVALDGCCPDCGGSGHGADVCDGSEHHTPPCPACEGSGLAPGARQMAAQRNVAWAERDAALAHVTELEAPGECASIHKLRAEVERWRSLVAGLPSVSTGGTLYVGEACPWCHAEATTDMGEVLTHADRCVHVEALARGGR